MKCRLLAAQPQNSILPGLRIEHSNALIQTDSARGYKDIEIIGSDLIDFAETTDY